MQDAGSQTCRETILSMYMTYSGHEISEFMSEMHTLSRCIALQDVSNRALSGAKITLKAELTSEIACAQGQAKSADAEQAVLQAADARGGPNVAAADGEKPLLTQPSKQALESATGTANVAEVAKSETPKDNCGRAAKLQQVSTSAPSWLSQHATRDRNYFALVQNCLLPVNLYVTEVALTSCSTLKRYSCWQMHPAKPCGQHGHAQHCFVVSSVCAMPLQQLSCPS